MMAGVAVATLLPTMLVGCDRAPPRQQAGKTAPAHAPQTNSPRNVQILAAAEDYEALTESAFDKPLPDLTAAHASALQKALAAESLLGQDQANHFNALNAQLDTALKASDRPALAVAAVESYRLLVSAQDATGLVPVDVSLLDYAGFKYDAINKAQPVKWDEMAAAAQFAKETWGRLAPQVKASGLSGAVDNAVAAMATAVQQKNEGAAAIAASNELALVDVLEEYFTSLR